MAAGIEPIKPLGQEATISTQSSFSDGGVRIGRILMAHRDLNLRPMLLKTSEHISHCSITLKRSGGTSNTFWSYMMATVRPHPINQRDKVNERQGGAA